MVAHTPPSPGATARSDDYYSPARVRLLVRLYPYLLDLQPVRNPELRIEAQQHFGPGWYEETMAKRADIRSALAWLAMRESRAAAAIWSYYIGDPLAHPPVPPQPLRAVADDLGVSHVTCWRWINDGVDLMAWKLGWRKEPEA